LDEVSQEVIIEHLTISNPDFYSFLADKEDPEEWTVRALLVGHLGLKQMVLANNVDYVKMEFGQFLNQASELFERQSRNLDSKIDDTFNLDNKRSPIAQFTNKLDSTFDLKNTQSPLYLLQQIILDYFHEDTGKFKHAVDYYFNKDEGELRCLLDATFDLKNTESPFSLLVAHIKEITGKDEETIKHLLDPHKTDSPAEMLKREIFDKIKELREQDVKELGVKIQDLREKELKEIRDAIVETRAIEEERERGTAKGFEFESYVLDELHRMANAYNDIVEHVGDTVGPCGKKGDIVIHVNGDSKRTIVIECKDRQSITTKQVRGDIAETLKNRSASYCIYLFSKKERMPKEFHPLNITDTSVVTYMENENLYYAYRLARIVLSRTNGDRPIDLSKISIETQKIAESIRDISQMQKEVTKILNSGNYLQRSLDKMHSNIEISLEKIQAYIGINPDLGDDNEDFSNTQPAPHAKISAKGSAPEMPDWVKEK